MDTFRLQLTETVQDLSFGVWRGLGRAGNLSETQPRLADARNRDQAVKWFLPLTDEEARAVALRLR
ncbi:hypothetical protein Misp05_63520 [Micromonospora sp. NBRC 107095]|nr:hypothetical protein Misp05_63520 [Micromonospora sp. NBRC 107095]